VNLVIQSVLYVLSLMTRPSVVSVRRAPSLIPSEALQLVLIHAQVVNMVMPLLMVQLILFVLVAMELAPNAQRLAPPIVKHAMQVGTNLPAQMNASCALLPA
jgi:hypothetical protein